MTNLYPINLIIYRDVLKTKILVLSLSIVRTCFERTPRKPTSKIQRERERLMSLINLFRSSVIKLIAIF